MAQTLRMVFKNQSGGSVALTMPNPRDNLTAAEVQTVMDLIIARNIFTSSGGDLATVSYAQIVDVNQNTLIDNR